MWKLNKVTQELVYQELGFCLYTKIVLEYISDRSREYSWNHGLQSDCPAKWQIVVEKKQQFHRFNQS